MGLLTSQTTYAATITWDGGGGGDTNWSTAANWSGDTIPGASDDLVFDGTSSNNSVVDAGHAGSVLSISINAGYGGAVSLSSGLTVGSGGFSIATASFSGGSSTIDMNGNFTMTGGTFTGTSGIMTLDGNWDTSAGGTFTHNSGTVTFDGSGDKTFNAATSDTFYNVIQNQTAATDELGLNADTMTVTNNFTLTSGDPHDGVIEVGVDFTIDDEMDGTSVDIDFEVNGTGAQNLTFNGQTFRGDFEVNKASGTMTVVDAASFNDGNVTITSGTMSVGANTLICAGVAFTFSQTGGTFNGGSATMTMNCALSITGGTFNATSDEIGLYQNFTFNGGTFNHSNGSLKGQGGGNTTFLASGGTITAYDFTCTKAIAARNCKPNNGVNIVVENDATFSKGSITSTTGTFEIQGNTLIHTNMADGSGFTTPITLSGTNAQTFTYSSTNGIHDGALTINKASETVTLGSDLVMDASGQNLTITSGTLDTSSGNNYAISVAGNWSNSGTFTPRSGTVTFTDSGGTSTISGSTTFNNFTCTAASKILTFTAGTTQTVSGTFTLTGTFGNTITVQSSSGGSAWNLNATTDAVSFVNASDSDASSGTQIVATSSTNSLGNTNWAFNDIPTAATVTFTQQADETGDVVGTVIIDDPDDDTSRMKIEASTDGGGSWFDPTITSASASSGSVVLSDAATYQITTISTASGANTITFTWDADLDTTVDVSNARFRITPNDEVAGDGSTAENANATLDTTPPTAPSLDVSSVSSDSSNYTVTGAGEVGAKVKVDNVDSGQTVAGDGSFSIEIPLSDVFSQGTSIIAITLSDTFTVSSATNFTYEKTSAGGGYYPPTPSPSPILPPENPPPVIEEPIEEPVEEEVIEEPIVEEEEEIVIPPADPANGEEEEFAMAGDELPEPAPPVTPPTPAPFVPAPFVPVPDVPVPVIIPEPSNLDRIRNFLGDLGLDEDEIEEALEEILNVGDEELFGIAESDPIADADQFEDAIQNYLDEHNLGRDEINVIDTDGDGLCDACEFYWDTDPLNEDTDNDNQSDAEEILFYGTDPTTPDERGDGTLITNFADENETSAGAQVISGFSDPNAEINIYSIGSDGTDNLIAHTFADEKSGIFSAITDFLPTGEYLIIATSIDEDGSVKNISNVITINVVDSSQLTTPIHDPEVLDENDNVVSSRIRLGLTPNMKEILAAGNQVIIMVTWESTVFGQVIIADAHSSIPSIFVPSNILEFGDHKVFWYALDIPKGIRSTTGLINFAVVPTPFKTTATTGRVNLIPIIGITILSLSGLFYFRRKSKVKVKARQSSK